MDAQHGFFADYRSSYNATDAARAWKQSKEWFHKYGVL
jgi:carboxymethylenebutenolidase